MSSKLIALILFLFTLSNVAMAEKTNAVSAAEELKMQANAYLVEVRTKLVHANNSVTESNICYAMGMAKGLVDSIIVLNDSKVIKTKGSLSVLEDRLYESFNYCSADASQKIAAGEANVFLVEATNALSSLQFH